MMPIPWDFLQENLVTQSEIARRLEIDPANITNWKRRDDWPAPVLAFPRWGIGDGELFWWPDVQAFCERHDVARGRGMLRGRPRKNKEDGPELVTRTEIAARRDVHISTVMGWIDRYADFPGPARTGGPQPLWSWPAVKAYLDAKGLPRYHRPESDAAAQERDKRILATLGLYPDGLTATEIADLAGADEEALTKGDPSELAVRVRVDDRLRRLEAAGKVVRGTRPSARRGAVIWKLAAG